ncbi:Monoacylglycerol lipase ABHD12 [Achaetomium macrosporum]|uniref:Monoacylglycerol lipase ABHD12 n=1 Tax=Achaetomium macrosporum TaxID=79813 RepID=A0AAN7C838_9PEZI|nr:Monoacylglycerol lipase ABHD12 [Achaetomium macrosporum]
MEPSALRSTILALCLSLGIPAAHTIYLHKATLTWFKDLDIPEQFGFAHHQVTPFYIHTADGERLHAWHVLPIGAYVDNQDALLAQGPEGGGVDRFQETLKFRLLKGNPEAKLSSGHPSEPGLIDNALAIVDWAINTAGVPPERIVIYGQSLGSAVAIAVVHELARREWDRKVEFAGLVVTATFSNVAQLTATYRIGGFIPVLSPLFDFFTSRLRSTWDNERRLSEFVQMAARYDITLIHAEDDSDIPMAHSIRLFRAAVLSAEAASKDSSGEIDESILLKKIDERKVSHGEGGSLTVWSTGKGDIRLEIPRYGVHDKVMSYPITGLAISRAFNSTRYGGSV